MIKNCPFCNKLPTVDDDGYIWCSTESCRLHDIGFLPVQWARRPKIKPELRALLAERDALRELVVHMWIHEGYPRNGYSDMTTEQKALYEKTIEDGVS